MKEIDKIRIRQWNQDNPYIQMKNLENAQPGYRVHTVNDDHHLYELPLETQNIILDWGILELLSGTEDLSTSYQ